MGFKDRPAKNFHLFPPLLVLHCARFGKVTSGLFERAMQRETLRLPLLADAHTSLFADRGVRA
jgi:hypothetical protein